MRAWKATSATSVLVLLLAVLSAPAQAQLWIGPAAIEVRAEDQGKAAAGAEVLLEFLDMEPPSGPAPIKLDSRGRAVIGSLAEGRWRMEVSRQGAMTYRAEILVRQGGKPDVVNAVQHNVPGAVTMMEVRLARARGGAGVAPPPREIAAAPAPRSPEIPEPSRPEPTPVEQPAVEQPAVEVRPIEPAPAPATPPALPEPQPEPRQSIPASEAEPVRPAPIPDPSTVRPAPAPTPAPTPAPQRPTPAPPRPTQAPQAAPQPLPTPAPAPSTPPVQAAPVPSPSPSVPQPALPVRRRSFQDRTCEECKTGESSLTVEVVVPPASPASGATGCGDGLRQALLQRDAAGLPAGCRMLRLELPQNVRYVGYRYEVQDGGASTDCQAGKDCPAQGARWPMDPLLFRDGAGKTTVSTAFENLSPDRERRAVLTVYYKDAGSSNAPRPMLQNRPRQEPRQERPPG